MTMKAAPAEMGTAAVQSSRLCILYAARRNRLRRRARDLLFGNQRIPGVFCSGVTENCQRTRTAGLSALCCAVFPCNTQSIPAEKRLAQHKNSSPPVTSPVFRYTLTKNRPADEKSASRFSACRKSLFAPLPSSFLSLKSSENCLIEREWGSFSPSLFPSDSVAKLLIIVF